MFSTSTWTPASRLAALVSGGFVLLLVGVLVGVVVGGGGRQDFVRVLTDPVTPVKAQADLKSKAPSGPLTVTVTTIKSVSHTVTSAAPLAQTVTVTQPASTITVTEPASSSDTTTTAP